MICHDSACEAGAVEVELWLGEQVVFGAAAVFWRITEWCTAATVRPEVAAFDRALSAAGPGARDVVVLIAEEGVGGGDLPAGLAVRQGVVAEVANVKGLTFASLGRLAKLDDAVIIVAGVDEPGGSLNHQEACVFSTELTPVHYVSSFGLDSHIQEYLMWGKSQYLLHPLKLKKSFSGLCSKFVFIFRYFKKRSVYFLDYYIFVIVFHYCNCSCNWK